MDSTHNSWPMRFGASVMLAIALLAWPATWHMAYAQALPQTTGGWDTSQQPEVDLSWVVSQLDEGLAENALINRRAQRLLRGDAGPDLTRTPNLVTDTPVESSRLPNLNADPNEAAQAASQAARIQPLSQADIVNGAQQGSDAGQGMMGSVRGIAVDMERVNPDQNQTSTGRVNVTEMLPGATARDAADLRASGAEIYRNPEILADVSEQNRRNLRRDGCRKTQFYAQELQNIDNANPAAKHRILKVEFFDVVKEPIAGTNPVEYQTVTRPSTYKRGTVNMLVATLGGTSTVYWDRVDETFAIKYTYTPFTAPKGRNYFTYNHWFAVDRGAGIERVYDHGLVSFGSPKDGWTPVASSPIQLGVKAAYLTADLYQTRTSYSEEIPGQPCPPDPPESCEVPSVGGLPIRWCPGSFGSNIVLMYDDQANPDERRVGKNYADMANNNASRKDYTTDPSLRAGVTRGLNAATSSKAQELAGTCRRDPISRIEIDRGREYGKPDVHTCSDTLINPYPQGCRNIKRSFGLTYVGEHNFVTVRAFNKVKVAIIDPQTGLQAKDKDGNLLYTYRKDPANVTGPVRTDFTIMGGSTCPGGEGCTTERLPDDPRGSSEGYYIEYSHTPMGGQYNTFAFDGVYVQGGGTGNFTHFGQPEAAWMPTGTASGNGTLHQLRLMAKAYSIPINEFAGCEKYMQYVADGMCRGAKLTCVDSNPTRTIGGVTFGPGLPNSGIVAILKKWGTDSSAVISDINNGEGEEPLPNGPPIVLLEDKMCWEAQGDSFTSCSTMEDQGRLKHYFKNNGEEWATDCHIQTDNDDIPLENSPSCKRAPEYDTCDSRLKGVFTGVCYQPTTAYDCGTTVQGKLPVVVEEQGDSCSGVVRCMGTECHRPNLTGNHGEAFAQAASGMEALNFMISEMVCAETGKPPASVEENCTPVVFGGKPMYCKKPIGRQIGLTPDCCKEARKGANKGGPSWMDYMQATMALYKISRNARVQQFLGGFDVYNNAASTFGEIAKPITDMYGSASKWVTDNVVNPFSSGFDNMFGSFFGNPSATGDVAAMGVSEVGKQGMISGAIDQLKQKLMQSAFDVLQNVSPEIANGIFSSSGGVVTGFTESAKEIMGQINMVFMVYSIARLIGHIIFACKQEEYEWGQNEKWRLCTYVGSCCSKKALFICVENRELYCCYKSIATRIMSEQIIKQNLTGNKPFGYRTSSSGGQLKKCNINCGGFTPMELASVDWSRVDLTEWTDVMVESGMINTADPRQNFGVTHDSVPQTMAVGRSEDAEGMFDQRAAAFKTVEGLSANTETLSRFTETLRDEGVEHCYDEANKMKMPFTYPGCVRQPATP